MDGIKQCNNAHFYREDLDSCPFCVTSEDVENIISESENISISNEIPSVEDKKSFFQKVKFFFIDLKFKISNISFKDVSLFSFLKNKVFYFHFILSSLVTLLLFYLLLIFLGVYTLNSKEFELKNFQSFTIEELESEIELNNLKYIILDSVYTDSVPKGTVYTQEPQSGTFVKEGREIYITINCNSSQKFSVPDVYNKSKREATNQLKSHFKVEYVKSANYNSISSVVTKLKVNNTEIFPNQQLIEGTTVTLYFGSGRSSSLIRVPLLVGSSTQFALEVIEQSNLKLGMIIAEGEILDTLNAIVVNQRPLSESKLQHGDMIDIVIRQYADTINKIDSLVK